MNEVDQLNQNLKSAKATGRKLKIEERADTEMMGNK
jgi:hypothetical protein